MKGLYFQLKHLSMYMEMLQEEMPRTEETMEIRLDEDVKTAEDVLKLGILQGDYVSYETRTRVLDNGYKIKIFR